MIDFTQDLDVRDRLLNSWIQSIDREYSNDPAERHRRRMLTQTFLLTGEYGHEIPPRLAVAQERLLRSLKEE